ncbi:MAG TPA: hypothetical protein VFH08_14435 [Chitinophagaceae bacterium]|nr:hypothetical protein [Chitinophagaceae bacterium]
MEVHTHTPTLLIAIGIIGAGKNGHIISGSCQCCFLLWLFSTMSLSINKNSPVPLLNADKEFIEEVYGYRLELEDKMRDFIRNQQHALGKGKRLIGYIKKEYHLK